MDMNHVAEWSAGPGADQGPGRPRAPGPAGGHGYWAA